jgi:hypothetical protein
LRFQPVRYDVSQFMLTLNLLELLEGSAHGGRVLFNA